MKITITTFLLFLILSSFGQSGFWNNYPDKIGSWKIKFNKIEEINVWEIKCDTVGKINDTALSMKYIYDTNGLLVEIRGDYSKDLKYLSWTKYFYNKKGYLIDKNQVTRRLPIDGVYKYEPPINYVCNKYEVDELIESIKYYPENPNKIIERETYEYDKKTGLLTKAMIYYNEKLNEIQIIEYIKFKK
jgi:hypothetical protein